MTRALFTVSLHAQLRYILCLMVRMRGKGRWQRGTFLDVNKTEYNVGAKKIKMTLKRQKDFHELLGNVKSAVTYR